MPILYSLFAVGLVVFSLRYAYVGFKQIFLWINSGQPERLTDEPQRRINSVLKYVFGQQKILDDKVYGFMHFFYLYGFIILGIGHLELILTGFTYFLKTFGLEPFYYRLILPHFLTHLYELSQDSMAFLVVIVATFALYRRISKQVPRLLPRSRDAEIILGAIAFLYITFFIYIGSETALRMQTQELSSNWLWHLPMSSLLGMLGLSFSNGFLGFVNAVGYFTHLGVFLGFLCYIPRSKHLHLVAAGPNIYFRHLDTYAKPKTIDFENTETFGVDNVKQLSWKSLMDSFACTECGRCDAVCPANLTHKPLKPKKVLHDIKINLRENTGDLVVSKEAKEGQIHIDEIWACTTCAACVEVCPVLIDSVPTNLIDMRRHLVLTQANNYPKELNMAFKGLENQSNPWGVSADKRADWAKSLDVPLFADHADQEIEYLFWVGCAGATDERSKKIQQSLVRVLKQAKVPFAILGCEEKCSGDPARRMGNEYIYDMLAKENINTLKKYKFKKIFATCPHCFNQLKNEYKDFGVSYTVQHHTELLAELLKDNRIPLNDKETLQKTVTFHDPCYLGRYNNQYDAPREALSKLKNLNLKEMEFSKRTSFCCGAGGGRMFMEEHQGKRINRERTDQALQTGCQTIVTGCPFCMTMMSDGVNDQAPESGILVKDLAEMIEAQTNFDSSPQG